MAKLTDKDLKLLISKRLTQLQKQGGKTIEQTADYLDIDYSQYFNLLRGKRLAKLTTIVNIANIYNIGLDWFVKEKAEEKTETKVNTLRLLSSFHKLNGTAQNIVLEILDNLARKKFKTR
ncbi:hypothetical protein NO2_0515 [Candidatus Termititenax persephonae]|uniref:HTH cro/C1-type domain-containing protein n=1 Tax=Candidatus Termititenax persephonae TaxID=2218525 RepID=A0A388TGI0_9BACT|nr:hypothetical protein NO2_0515 [Candidatus Termititenax persephonae]